MHEHVRGAVRHLRGIGFHLPDGAEDFDPEEFAEHMHVAAYALRYGGGKLRADPGGDEGTTGKVVHYHGNRERRANEPGKPLFMSTLENELEQRAKRVSTPSAK